MQTLMLFIDGLGMGPDDPDVNPLMRGDTPHLTALLRESTVPIDACLGVPGLPQSATGQTALLTGVNAPQMLGRHQEAFPGPELRRIIRENNLFDQLLRRGYSCTFANAYWMQDIDQIRKTQSVTTVATLKAFGDVRKSDCLLRDEAVYQDLTRARLRARGYHGPLITPAQAGRHLLNIAAGFDFTLFEYFQTDLVGHRGLENELRQVLIDLDSFVGVARTFADTPDRLFLLSSDHGNIEDNRTRVHTVNPVPLVALGLGAEKLRASVRSIQELVPALMHCYPPRNATAASGESG